MANGLDDYLKVLNDTGFFFQMRVARDVRQVFDTVTEEIPFQHGERSSKLDILAEISQDHSRSFILRRSQEAFELFLKTMFKFIGRDYPQKHDIAKEVYAVFDALKGYGFSAQKVAQIVHRNRTLGLWREKSFYGDEELGVASIFTEPESKLALTYAEDLSIDCYGVKDRIWREIVERK
jgi:uncharacterized protein (UPF0335 family)